MQHKAPQAFQCPSKQPRGHQGRGPCKPEKSKPPGAGFAQLQAWSWAGQVGPGQPDRLNQPAAASLASNEATECTSLPEPHRLQASAWQQAPSPPAPHRAPAAPACPPAQTGPRPWNPAGAPPPAGRFHGGFHERFLARCAARRSRAHALVQPGAPPLLSKCRGNTWLAECGGGAAEHVQPLASPGHGAPRATSRGCKASIGAGPCPHGAGVLPPTRATHGCPATLGTASEQACALSATCSSSSCSSSLSASRSTCAEGAGGWCGWRGVDWQVGG